MQHLCSHLAKVQDPGCSTSASKVCMSCHCEEVAKWEPHGASLRYLPPWKFKVMGMGHLDPLGSIGAQFATSFQVLASSRLSIHKKLMHHRTQDATSMPKCDMKKMEQVTSHVTSHRVPMVCLDGVGLRVLSQPGMDELRAMTLGRKDVSSEVRCKLHQDMSTCRILT